VEQFLAQTLGIIQRSRIGRVLRPCLRSRDRGGKQQQYKSHAARHSRVLHTLIWEQITPPRRDAKATLGTGPPKPRGSVSPAMGQTTPQIGPRSERVALVHREHSFTVVLGRSLLRVHRLPRYAQAGHRGLGIMIRALLVRLLLA